MNRWRHPQALVAIGLILVALYALRHALSSTTLVVFAVVVPSIILHEISHGVTALAFGDDTAKRAGRLTLNPIRHIDPLGTLVLPGVLALVGLGAFGYAKPVPVNPSRMRSPRNDAVVVSLAGPFTNLLLAGVSVLLLRYVRPAGTAANVHEIVNVFGVGALGLLDRIIYLLGFVNVTLAVFNALPIPPLDGSAVLERLLPRRAWPTWLKVRTYAMPALLLLVLLDPGHFLIHVFGPAERAWAALLSA
ncbi:MAG: site-2 protease family protein [Actinomycetota bacterium]|nr:site-2 protease family protein [Actinomycetota bacterium]